MQGRSLKTGPQTRWLAVAFFAGVALAMAAEELILTARENRVQFAAPDVHFLTGRPLERLHNAAPVPFDFEVTLWSGTRTRVFRRTAARFVISYDLWEETYSVNRVAGPRRSASHMTAPEAEAWCLEQLEIDVTGLASEASLWARMEIRALDDEESAQLFGRGNITEEGISLTSLIEIFSRPPRSAEQTWTLESGPVTLRQLRARGG